MPVPLDRYNSVDTNGDDDTDDGNSSTYSQRRPPIGRVSFSRSVRPSRSRLAPGDATPNLSGNGGVPLGERIQSIPESVARMSIAIPTGLAQPEATPLPVLSMIVLGIAMMGEFLTANVSAPWILHMVESFGVAASDVGTYTGILVSVFFISQFATSLLWASIADRFGRRIVLFTSLVGGGLACIAFGTSKSLGFAIATRLLQGAFGGAVGVARGSVASISDTTNEAQAYAILGFCWGFGGVGGAVIGGVFDHPAQKWGIFEHSSLFIEFPYLLPTIVAAFITVAGGLLALTLNRDGGPRTGTLPNCGTGDLLDSEARLGIESQAQAVPTRQETAENAPLRPTSGVENYGSTEHSAPTEQIQTEDRLGVPLGERTWTQSSAVSGGSGYGDVYRSRFSGGVRHRSSWVSAVARRYMGADDTVYADNEPEEREPRLAERILMANELTVTSLGDLWVASALTMDAEEDAEIDESNDRFASGLGAESALEAQHGSAVSGGTARATSVEPRARSVSASRRTARSFNGAPYRNNHPYSLALSANYSSSRLVPSSYPAIMQNPGLSSPSPAFSFLPDGPDTSGTPNLQPIFEGKPVGFEAQEVEPEQESVFSQLPLAMIFQYGLLALHSTTHDQVFMSYLVSKRDCGGLALKAGDFAQLIAVMCFAQIVFQFYLYPMMGPPLGHFSHLSMFRIGGVLMALSYLSVILVRPLAKSSADSFTILAALSLPTAVRYCGITFSYTAVSILLNYMSPPHAIGLANGLAQSIVSLARFMGPILGGYLWSFSTHADPEGFGFGFWFCTAFCILALLHSLTLR